MKYLQTAVIGCIAVLAISLLPHIIENRLATLFGIVFFVFVLWIAHKVGEHFHHGHTHEGDSELDKSIGATLIIVNVFHPLVDGFALYGTYASGNKYIFASVFVGVILHEIFRQSALVLVFREFGFKSWKVILPAFTGLSFGWLLGVVGGVLPSAIEPYIDVLTFCAYSFIVSEHIFAHKEVLKKRSLLLTLLAGILVALVFVTLFKAH
jgi:zinc transporter ZupT